MALINVVYSAGTITVTNGQVDISGVGTAWQLNNVVGAILLVNGTAAIVDSASAENAAKLKRPWSGPSAANAGYDMWLVSAEAETSLVQHSRIVEILSGIKNGQPSNKNLTGLAALASLADTLPYFTDNQGHMDLVALKAWARSLLSQNMAADKLPYGTGSDTMGLVDFKAWARSLFGLAPAADKGIYFADANTTATYTLTAYARTLLGENNGAGVWTKLGGASNASSIKHPDGTIEQWGVIYNAASDYALTFPLAFPSACYAVTMTPYINAGLGTAYVVMTSNTSRTGTDVRCRNITGAGVGQQNDLVVFWKAVGK